MIIGLIFGGSGVEHEASLESARELLDRYAGQGLSFHLYGIRKSKEWVAGPDAWDVLYGEASTHLLPASIAKRKVKRSNHLVSHLAQLPPLSAFEHCDAFFPLVHGTSGEDGSLIGLLNFLGKPIVGCEVLSSAMGFDKWTAKQLVEAKGQRTAKAIKVDPNWLGQSDLLRVTMERLGSRNLVVKPNSSGSGFGVSLAQSERDLRQALSRAFRYSRFALIEEQILGVETNIAVVGDHSAVIAGDPIVDLPNKAAPMSYHDKYLSSEFTATCATGFDTALTKRLQSTAESLYASLSCTGLSRVDLFVDEFGEVIFNEINTMPSIGPDDYFAMSMARKFKSYSHLIDHLVLDAFRRAGQGQSRKDRITSGQSAVIQALGAPRIEV